MKLFIATSAFMAVAAVGAADDNTAEKAHDPSSPSKESYIVMMKDEPILTHDIDTTQSNQERKLNRKSANSNAKNKKHKKNLKNKHAQAAETAGISKKDMVHEYYYCSNGFQAFMSSEQAAKMRNQEGVAQVVKDQMMRMDESGGSGRRLSESSLSSNVDPITSSVWSNQGRPPKIRDLTITTPDFLGLTDKGGPWDRDINGEGVVVGVIDDGIWPEHPSFEDDGSYDPLPGFIPNSDSLPCEFGNTTFNPEDHPFKCNNKLLGARLVLDARIKRDGIDQDEFYSARDHNGHGTHTASTAAGNRNVPAKINEVNLGKISGMAPRARIISYKALSNQGGLFSDAMKAVDYACQDGVDVINFSAYGKGVRLFEYDGLTSPVDVAFLNADKAGIFVATCAGNEGLGPTFPFLGPSTTTKSSPWYTVVAASTQPRTFQGSVSSSDGKWDFTGKSITNGTDGELPLVDSADVGSEYCCSRRANTEGFCERNGLGKLNETMVKGKIVLCQGGITPSSTLSTAVLDAGGVGMILYNDRDSSEVTYQVVPSVRINNSDGLAIKEYIKAVGTNAVAQINPNGITSTLASTLTEDVPVIADFSSRGPNLQEPNIIRPDITAPGVAILAGYSPKAVEEIRSPEPGFFAFLSGTSMASPHIAGIFALMKQAHPNWSPSMAKSALMTTSYQNVSKKDADGSLVQAEPFDMGSGHVNPTGKVNKGSFLQPGLVYDARYLDYIAFFCKDFPQELLDNLYSPTSTCEELENQGFRFGTENLNYPSIGISSINESETVTRKVTSVATEKGYRKYKAVVVSPEGYEVVVDPGTIQLKRGEWVSFEVTITNVDGPLDEWKFGSLTWVEKTGKYEVYSPIAAKFAQKVDSD